MTEVKVIQAPTPETLERAMNKYLTDGLPDGKEATLVTLVVGLNGSLTAVLSLADEA